jgi:competence protein ComEC
MTSPWLLVLAGGVTAGALLGVPGGLMWLGVVGIAVLPGRRPWRALMAVALVGAALGTVRVGMDATDPLSPDVVESVAAEVVVRSVPQTGPSGLRAVVRVERIAHEDDAWQSTEGEVLVLFGEHAPENLAKGDRLRLRWDVSTEDASDFGRFVRSSGAGGFANAFSSSVIERGQSVTTPVTGLRELVTRRIAEAIPGDGGALIAGFVTGDDSGLSRSTREAFERTGMSHITAVSGSNVAVLLTIWFFLVPTGRMRRSLPAMIGIMLIVWLYVLLVGLGPGAVRAGLFATIIVPAARLGRRPDPLTAMVLASATMLLVQPDFAHNVGFWLSLAASTAIVVCIDRRPRSRARLLVSGVAALVAAQVATLPIIVWIFGGWSPASLLANLIVGPIVAAVFPVSFMFALLVTVLPWLSDLVGWLPGIVADVIIAIVESIAREASMLRLGFATSRSIALISVMSAAVIWLLSGETRRWLIRVAWRFPGVERYAGSVAVGVGLGVWLVVLARTVLR